MTQSVTFTAAIRQALTESDTIDMREVAQRAISHMPEHLVLEAAITHISKMARRCYNDNLGGTAISPLLAEQVVSFSGVDAQVGSLEDQEREWLAANREALASGLRDSAERLRQGPYLVSSPEQLLVAADIARMERRNEQLRIAVKALEDFLDSADAKNQERMAAAQRLSELSQRCVDLYCDIADRLVKSWRKCMIKRSKWARTENAIRVLEEEVGRAG